MKYPKTFHFSWSENLQNDDRKLENDAFLDGKTIVVSEKIDGENTGMTRDSCHARSLDSRDHLSRHWIKGLHATIKHEIPDGWKIFGENVYAKHSIFYPELTSYFYVFSIWKDDGFCLSWKDTEEFCQLLGLEIVPVLYYGIWDIDKVKSCFTGKSKFGLEQEGYVVRNADSFHYDDFQNNIGKFVRDKHIKTDDHWMHGEVVQNLLRKI